MKREEYLVSWNGRQTLHRQVIHPIFPTDTPKIMSLRMVFSCFFTRVCLKFQFKLDHSRLLLSQMETTGKTL